MNDINDIIENFDLNRIYNDLKLHSKDSAVSGLLILIYLQQNNISFQDYFLTNESNEVWIKNVENAQEGKILNDVNDIIGENILKNRRKVFFPNFFIKGYLISYYFMSYLNDRKQLKNYISDNHMNKRNNIAAFRNFREGVMHFFTINFNINQLHEYLRILTIRRNAYKENPNIPYVFNIISVWLLLTFNTNSVWDIKREHILVVMKILKKVYLSWRINPIGAINKINVRDIFNCRFSEIINWWRAAYLGHESRGEVNNPLDTPPKGLINYKELFEVKTTETLLQRSINILKDNQKKKEIIDVYLNNCSRETHNTLVNQKINNFAKYYNFCRKKSIDYTNTASVKTYVNERCILKENKSKNNLYNNLRGYFNLAIKSGYYKELRSNPVSYQLNLKQSKFSKLPDAKVIPESEIKRIFAIQDKLTKFERLFIKLLYYTGLRVGEALLLTVGCIIEITQRSVLIVIPPFKQRKEPYTILIEDLSVIEVIKELIEQRIYYGRVPNSITGEAKLWLLVETTDDGRGLRHITKQRGNQIIEKACKLAGIRKYTNHCFRHSFAHRKLYDEKYDPESVSMLMGHACLDTLAIYSKLTNEEKLKYFSIMLRRRRATQHIRENMGTTVIRTPDSSFQVCLSNCHNRWCGNGWCSSDGSVKCPKRYISHYTCLLYRPDPNRKSEMVNDFYANLALLKTELLKEIPIQKDVNFFINVLDCIISHLHSINYSTEEIETNSSRVREEAINIIKKERRK